MGDVKGTGLSRRDRAAATRLRILTSAHDLFVEQEYAGTTMDEIAARAGVAVQTVYYTFRTKGLLLREVVEHAGAGRMDAPAVDERPWMQEALSENSGDRALAVAVEHGVDIYVRAAPLWRSLHAAAISDPEVDTYVQAMAAGRRAGMGALVARLHALGYLRKGLTPDRATDLVYALFTHETFLALTRDAQWTTEEYKAWQYPTLRWQLAGATDTGRDALRSLSYRTWVSDPHQGAADAQSQPEVRVPWGGPSRNRQSDSDSPVDLEEPQTPRTPDETAGERQRPLVGRPRDWRQMSSL